MLYIVHYMLYIVHYMLYIVYLYSNQTMVSKCAKEVSQMSKLHQSTNKT